MKIFRLIQILVLLCSAEAVIAQATLIKDLDGDQISDTIMLNRTNSELICRLSTQNFKAQKSKRIEYLSTSSGLEATKSGFKFFNYQMREGYTCQFRFNKVANKMELIGMSRYNDGNAQLDGSGESSVNLLTGGYIGNWNSFDAKHRKLIKIKTIQQPLQLPRTFLEEFSEKQPQLYADECEQIIRKHKGYKN
jgi:hypothetical protein